MQQRQLYLTDVDLRWGVTEAEAEQGKVLAVCLEEIDRCRPFFLGLLGERYGWVPETLPEEAVIEFPWVDDRKGHSVTELEILHGVLNNPEMAGRAFFFFRELSAKTPLPADYQAETPEAAEKLAKLKQHDPGRETSCNRICLPVGGQGRRAGGLRQGGAGGSLDGHLARNIPKMPSHRMPLPRR